MSRRRGWVPDEDKVIVVAAGVNGLKHALEFRVYVCQNRRGFQPAKFLAFYANRAIEYVAEIDGAPEDDVMLAHRPELRGMIPSLDYSPYQMRTVFRVQNLKRVGPIQSDCKATNGRRIGWTRSQRYTTIGKLKAARQTSEL